jgi:hypothetical protein
VAWSSNAAEAAPPSGGVPPRGVPPPLGGVAPGGETPTPETAGNLVEVETVRWGSDKNKFWKSQCPIYAYYTQPVSLG